MNVIWYPKLTRIPISFKLKLMSAEAVERKILRHAGRVVGRLENGHNTPLVRQEAMRITLSGGLPMEGHVVERLYSDSAQVWSREGDISDSELDTVRGAGPRQVPVIDKKE